MSRSIVLFGMMGVGKSTIARRLGSRLGRDVIDTDEEVERHVGTPVAAVFAEHGEARFRELEREAIRAVAHRDDAVISVGGGAVLDERNVAALRSSGVLIHLHAPVQVLLARVSSTGAAAARPLLEGADPRQRLGRLAEERGPCYREVADHEVDATGRPGRVTDRVLAAAVELGDVLTAAERQAAPARGPGTHR